MKTTGKNRMNLFAVACLFVVTVPIIATAESGLASLRQGPMRIVPGQHGVGQMIAELSLSDIDGQSMKLSDYRNHSAVVIAFTNTSCPICKKYTPTLAAIEDQFSSRNVAFLYVNPTASDSVESIRAAISSNHLEGPYVRDQENKIAKALGATHTTDVFVLDAKRTLVYRGAVDDQYGFGYTIDAPRSNYLIDAIETVLDGKGPLVGATEAAGCPLDLRSSSATDLAKSDETYHNRISRIVQAHCVKCHREGGVAPFALEQYDDLVSQSGAIRRVIDNRIMPPWFAAKPADGHASDFINDTSLSELDRTALLHWLDGDKREGDPKDAPVATKFVEGWQIGEPDLVLQLPKPIAVKASGTMAYQNVTIETGFTADRYIKAVEVTPTARDVVHHCLVFVLPPAKDSDSGRDRRAGDDEADGFFAAYAPGYDALVFNDGFGKLIPAGSRLKFQLHYTPNGTATTDQTKIGFQFTEDAPERLVSVAGIAQPRLSIPPHAENHQVTASVTLPRDATVLAFFPHMHLRGKAFQYDAMLPDGKSLNLLEIPRYDFNWQLSYRLAEPLELPAGTKITATAWYDNSKNNPANPDPSRTVPWGQQTYDEMMIGYVEYHMKDGKLGRFASAPAIEALRNLGSGKNVEAYFRNLDKDHDGKLTGDELPAQLKTQLLRLDINHDGAISADEAERLKQILSKRKQ